MKNIFLADDDEDDRMFFEDALKRITTPTELTFSNNGLSLMGNLEVLTAHPPPDVIFLDLNMPLKNGFECLKEIRASSKLNKIPIVIFSTSRDKDIIDKAYQYGANYYISKPPSFELLIKAIEIVLSIDMWQTSETTKENFLLTIT